MQLGHGLIKLSLSLSLSIYIYIYPVSLFENLAGSGKVLFAKESIIDEFKAASEEGRMFYDMAALY